MSFNEHVVEAHWNVTGPMLNTLHTLFETQYAEHALAGDEIAERIRAIGALAPGGYTEFAELALVKEDRGSSPAMEMISNLVADQEATVESARKIVEVAETAGDQATADLRCAASRPTRRTPGDDDLIVVARCQGRRSDCLRRRASHPDE